MYRKRLVCAAYVRMAIIPLLGGARGWFSNVTFDVHRRNTHATECTNIM
jgi:hypothetical protein